MQVGKLEYDENLSIAIGMSVSSKIWKNTKITWNALVQKLSTPVVTAETYKQFMNATKEEQSKIKDVGGFVGGTLKEGKRKNGYVLNRSLITLDIDFGLPSIFDLIKERLSKYSYAFYSTHKSSKDIY